MSYLMNEYAIYSFGCAASMFDLSAGNGDTGGKTWESMRIFAFSVDLCIYGLYLDGIPGDRTWDTR